MAAIKIVGLSGGQPTPFDGQFVVEYDPEHDGCDPDGLPMVCVLRTTPDREQALDLPVHEATELWKRQCVRDPVRPDGRPNRPLTAFTVEIT